MRRIVAMLTAASLAACSQEAPKPAEAPRAAATPDAAAQAAAREQEGLEAGVAAVAYGLPLVIMDLTMRRTTNVAAPAAFAAPVNQFANVPAFPDASFKDVVRANVDTLYSSAFLDLSREPLVLSVPDTKGRYYLMPMLDAWTNVFASPGKRTTGTKAGHFAITGPGWSGTLPRGLQELKSPTNMAWIIGRTQTNGPKDYPAVHAIQKSFKLVPLSAYGKAYAPPKGTVDTALDMKTPPVEQLAKMPTAAFLGRLAALMAANPAPAEDAPVLAKLAKMGVVPGQPFDPGKLDPAFAKGLERAVPVALAKLQEAAKAVGKPVNGWHVPPMILGKFGTDYGARAVVALMGLGANLPADAVYPSAYVDAEGQPLSGKNRYVLHFDKGQLPPANAFWSVTMYDPQSFFVANPLNRYALSSWMPLVANADGSLDLYLQPTSPGKGKESNWLPSATGDFNVTMRIYWPREALPSVLDGTWAPPPVRKAE